MPLPHKNSGNVYLVHTDANVVKTDTWSLFGTSKESEEMIQENKRQEQYKLQIEELEKEKKDLNTEMFRLQKGFSYLICFKELIDFEITNPSALKFWNGHSQTFQTCKANAQGICEIMDFIEKNPNYDIETFRDYYLPYLTNESTRFKQFEGLAVGTLKRELEEAAKDLYFKKRVERETKKALDVFTLGAEYATSSWPSFNNNALNLELEEAKAITGRMYYEVLGLQKDIKIVKDKVRLLQRGFSYLIYYKDLIDFEKTNPSVLNFWDVKSKKNQTCEANAQVICDIMYFIEKNPDYDIETLRQAYLSYFHLPYLPPRGTDGVLFRTLSREKRELEEAAKDLIIKRERENEEAAKDLIKKRERENAALMSEFLERELNARKVYFSDREKGLLYR
jgi:hypothetical protein